MLERQYKLNGKVVSLDYILWYLEDLLLHDGCQEFSALGIDVEDVEGDFE